MVQPARAVQCNGSPATGNERRCVQRVASASRSDSQATGTAESPGMMIALMVCSGPRPNECAVFEQKKRQGRDERRSLSGPQQLSRFESRESATVAGRAVSTTTRWAALLGREADARPALSVLALTENAHQRCSFRLSVQNAVAGFCQVNFGRNYSFWPNFCLISAELCSPPFEVQKTEVQKSARN